MLEKIGLPPKPSLRGNSWVVDASHCQGCSSQFTFINRRHHCRRCGGIFCNSCTQQRMLLRGQGDSPVRICDPCKKLEEAARFEMRYGNKSKSAKGGSKSGPKKDDDILNRLSSTQKNEGSSSNVPEASSQAEGGNILRDLSLDHQSDMLIDAVGSSTPEDLREQALVEKKKHKTLKAEGKPEEALRAFKRGKELERQAAALEISLRKNRKKALSSSNTDDILQTGDDNKKKLKEKDDLSAELKELGWSEADLRGAKKKPANFTLEGELSSLLREVNNKKPDKQKRAIGTNKSQVIVHKKRALELKREGNLVEAKEELKRAKILERKIEEEELLGEANDDSDSDDELSALIRSMDGDDGNNNDLSERYQSELNYDFNNFAGIGDDVAVDGDFDVTDADMDDPEIANALKSLGWTEEERDSSGASSNRESVQTEIMSLKREALAQKRAGNTAEAMTLLKKVKLLENELEKEEEKDLSVESVINQTGPKSSSAPPKSKYMIQKELIALKKKAFAFRREGRFDESEEELKKAKVLEEQLEDMNKAPPTVSHPIITHEEEEEEVTDQDLLDPAYLSVLKNLGWQEDEDNVKVPSNTPKENNNRAASASASTYMSDSSAQSRKSKSEIQRELLALKRKARNLRREGETEEADEVLKMTKLLEAQLQELEEPTSQSVDFSSEDNNKRNASTDSPQIDAKSSPKVDPHEQKPNEIVHENEKPNSLQQEILAHKRKAVAFKREGKLIEAKEELRQAKLLEKKLLDTPQTTTKFVEKQQSLQTPTKSSDASASSVSSVDKEASPSSVNKPMSSRDRFKLQQESLSHKRKALKLRREGKTAEADAEFELAKALESQLQESESPDSAAAPVDDVGVEDFLDPQLLSALQSIGLDDGQTRNQPVESTDNAKQEREQLMEQIKSEKVKAVNLKRSGKQGEALDALRRAKLCEKKLQSLNSK